MLVLSLSPKALGIPAGLWLGALRQLAEGCQQVTLVQGVCLHCALPWLDLPTVSVEHLDSGLGSCVAAAATVIQVLCWARA